MHLTRNWNKFRAWLSQPLGQSLIKEQTQKINEFIHMIFGFHLVLLGEPPLLNEMEESPILHKILIHPSVEKQKDCSVILSKQDKLPILQDEIDLVYLAHCLEFNVNPHEVLRESYTILKPEGHVIISGFNPWSFWGVWRYIVRYFKPVPWDTHFISLRRLKDWLALLGFDVVQAKTCFFRPPIENENWLDKMMWMEKLGHFLFPFFGTTYIILARKRVLTMTPLRVQWKRRRRMIPAGFAEPVTRIPRSLLNSDL